MFKLYRFENFLYTVKMTGSEIDRHLEHAAGLWFDTMEDRNDYRITSYNVCYTKLLRGFFSNSAASPSILMISSVVRSSIETKLLDFIGLCFRYRI